eukprot:TRINITY_DN41684_c0_g1_i1.p1 TRINITY_DN41684_c0_g1~~TRINITY_DN41684_c0_g1_i1.p1  ORF type:complete len:937 (+),score=105.36 TRINITY_DN41684_c0_g1_i1:46-2856(+)
MRVEYFRGLLEGFEIVIDKGSDYGEEDQLNHFSIRVSLLTYDQGHEYYLPHRLWEFHEFQDGTDFHTMEAFTEGQSLDSWRPFCDALSAAVLAADLPHASFDNTCLKVLDGNGVPLDLSEPLLWPWEDRFPLRATLRQVGGLQQHRSQRASVDAAVEAWTAVDILVNASDTADSIHRECSKLIAMSSCYLLSAGQVQLLDGGSGPDSKQTLQSYGIGEASTILLTDFVTLLPVNGSSHQIEKTEARGISLKQLWSLLEFSKRRCDEEGFVKGWIDDFGEPRPISYSEMNLYQATHWIIKPATHTRRCSYVELITTDPETQRPLWFVSHAWLEAVVSFVQCVERHCLLRGLPATSAFWVCAYANNQHALGMELVANPRETSFFRAMRSCVGVLLILDSSASPFERIWCCFEESVALTDEERTRMLLDIATSDKGVEALLVDGECYHDRSVKSVFKGEPGRALVRKREREARFPLALMRKGLVVDIWTAKSSKEDDKRRILNSIAKVDVSHLEDPPKLTKEHETVNNGLRSTFAVAAWPQWLRDSYFVQHIDELAGALKNDRTRQRLHLTFDFMAEFDCHQLRVLCSNLPQKLEEFVLELSGCDVRSEGLAVVWPESLRMLTLTFQGSTYVNDPVIVSLVQRLPPTLQKLDLCLLECSNITDVSVEAIAHALPHELNELQIDLLGTHVTLPTLSRSWSIASLRNWKASVLDFSSIASDNCSDAPVVSLSGGASLCQVRLVALCSQGVPFSPGRTEAHLQLRFALECQQDQGIRFLGAEELVQETDTHFGSDGLALFDWHVIFSNIELQRRIPCSACIVHVQAREFMQDGVLAEGCIKLGGCLTQLFADGQATEAAAVEVQLTQNGRCAGNLWLRLDVLSQADGSLRREAPGRNGRVFYAGRGWGCPPLRQNSSTPKNQADASDESITVTCSMFDSCRC